MKTAIKKAFLIPFLALTIFCATISLSTPKAEAGIIGVCTGTPAAAVMILGGIGLVALGAGGLDYAGSAIFMLVGVFGIVVGEENSVVAADEMFQTVPTYLFDEMNAMALEKLEMVEETKEGLKIATFTEHEVDELFTLANDNTSKDELAKLRLLLTEEIAI